MSLGSESLTKPFAGFGEMLEGYTHICLKMSINVVQELRLCQSFVDMGSEDPHPQEQNILTNVS
jgi:hypothetical protein